MKKSIFIYFVLVGLLLTGCSNMNSDAQKVADLQGKAQSLIQETLSGNAEAIEESKKFTAEAANLANEMNEKYKTLEEQKEFAEAVFKAMGNCK